MDKGTQVAPEPSALSSEGAPRAGRGSTIWIRVGAWVVAVSVGAAQAWATRFTMNPDGISYLDIGDAYWRHDWHNAINAYWSPLYSWILGLFINVIKPTPYWEYPLAHLVNFLIYVAALGCFEFFLAAFISQHQVQSKLLADREIGIPSWAWWLTGYSVFASSALLLITLALVTPDMCVMALVFLVSGLLLRTRKKNATRTTFVLLGVVLGVGYLAKAVMFPLAFLFLLTLIVQISGDAKQRREVALALFAFALIAAPFVLVLSVQKGRFTFGDSGRITYEIFLNKVAVFTPTGSALAHPVRIIFTDPIAHEFRQPIDGTYPPWYDPSYWHEGLAPRFDFTSELRILAFGCATNLFIIGSVFQQLNFTVGLFLLYFANPSPWACFKSALKGSPLLLIPAIIAIGAYVCVYTEPRYVAPFVAVLWMIAFAGVHLHHSAGMTRLVSTVVIGIAITTAASLFSRSVRDWRQPPPDYVQAAEAFRNNGVDPGAKIAVISDQPFDRGGAFVARLAGAKIIAQAIEPSRVFGKDRKREDEVLKAFANAGARFALTDSIMAGLEPCWHKVGTGPYSLCALDALTLRTND